MADIKRIYEVEIGGVQKGLEELDKLSTTFDTLDAQFKELNKTLGGATDSTLIESLNKQIAELKIKLEDVTKAKAAYSNETKVQADSDKKAAEAATINEKAQVSLQKIEVQKLKTANDLEVQKKRQIDLQQKSIEKTKQEAAEVENEEEIYRNLTKRIGELSAARERLRTEGTAIVFEDVPLTGEQAIKVEQNLIALQKQLKNETGLTKNEQQSIIDSEKIKIGLLERERNELQTIVNVSKEGSTIVFKNQILTYQEAIDKLAQLRQAEELEKKQQAELTTNINTTSESIVNLNLRQEQLAASIQKAKAQSSLISLAFGKPVEFEGQNFSLTETERIQKGINGELQIQQSNLNNLNSRQDEINANVEKEKQLREVNNIVEDSSLQILTKRREELDKLISSRSTSSGTPISFEGELLSLDQAKQKREEIIALQQKEIQGNLTEGQLLQKQVSDFDKLVASRKELQNLLRSASISGEPSIQLDGNTLSIKQGSDLLIIKQAQEQKLIDLFNIEKGVHDKINIAEQTSISQTKAAAEQLSLALRNRATGATDVSVSGLGTIGIQEAQTLLAKYQLQISQYTEQQKLRKQAEDTVSGSMRELDAQTKILTQANIQLTAANAQVGLSLTPQQWNALRASLIGIAPEVANLSLNEVNAGKASELLTTKIFANNVALRDFKRDISGSNTLVGDYTKGIVDAFKNLGLGGILQKEKADVDVQIRQLVVRINELNKDWKAAFASGGVGLDKIEAELQQTVALHTQLTGKVQTLNTAYETTNSVGAKLTSGLSAGFKNLDQTIGRTLVTYIGFQAAISGITRLITIDKQLSDQFADLQRIIGISGESISQTREKTDKLVQSLKELDTRTSLTQLQGFAIIAARAGVAAESIAGVTSAINKLQLISGNELGDVETAVTAIVKILNVFQGAGSVTEQSVLKLGNALVTLSNEGVASGKFMVNFTERLAGIRGATNISLESVLGLSAAFEETGQTSEIAATSIAQVLNKISLDVPKFARLAGQTTEGFRTLLRENPAEAVIQLAEALAGGGKAADEIGASFAGLGITGVRVKTTFQDIGANADFFRKRIADATLAMVDQNVILAGSENKQLTFAATIDKIGASLTKAFDNKTFVNLLDSIAGAVLFLIKTLAQIPFAIVLTGLSALTAGWALYKGQLITVALQEAFVNKQSALNNIARLAERLGIISVTEAQRARSALLTIEGQQLRAAVLQRELAAGASELEAVATADAAIATTALNTALKISPIGIFLAIIALVLPLIGAFASKTEASTVAINKQTQSLKSSLDVNTQIGQNVKEQTDKTINSVKALIEVIKDETLSLGTRKLAYQQLIQIAPEFIGTINTITDSLKIEGSQITNLMAVYDQFIIKIDQLARAKAIATVSEKLQADLVTKQVSEEAAKNAKVVADQQLLQEQSAHISASGKKNPLAQQAIKNAKDAQTQANDDLNQAILDTKNQQKLVDALGVVRKKEVSDLDIQQKDINEKLKHVFAGSVEEIALQKQRDEIQVKINNTLGVQNKNDDLGLDFYLDRYNSTAERIKVLLKTKALTQLEAHENQSQITALEKQQKFDADAIKRLSGTVPGTGTTPKGSSSTGRVQVERDELNEIETIRARDIASENLRVAKITQIRKLFLDEEIQHLEKLQSINDIADNAKVAHLQIVLDRTLELEKSASGKKLQNLKSDAIREEKDIAEAELAIATRENATNEQILALKQKRLDEEVRIEKKDLDARKAQLQLDFEQIANTPDVLPSVLAAAHKKMDDQIIAQTISHYNDLIKLAQSFNLSTELLEEEKDKAVSDAIKASLNDDRDIYESYFKDIDKKLEQNISAIRDKLNTIRESILSSGKSSNVQTFQLGVVDNIQAALTATEKLTEEQLKYNQAVKDYESRFSDLRNTTKGIAPITKEQLEELHNAVVTAKIDLKSALDTLNQGIQNYSGSQNTIVSIIGNTFGKLFKITEEDLKNPDAINQKIGNQERLAAVIQDTYATAKLALDNFFSAEKAHIDASLKANEARLQTEFDQQKARAQSQAEQQSLDRQFAAAKKIEEEKAFEANKRLQLAQAKINFGIELSNLALIAFAPTPQNILTVGTFGVITYAIQAALAIARYISTISNIQSAQFSGEYGMALKGGKVAGRSHAHGGNKFLFDGTVYEDEVDEIRVIRTKDSPKNERYNVRGTQEEIASFLNVMGGGIQFKPGAIGSRLEFGGSVRSLNKFDSGGSVFALAPTNPNSFLNNDNIVQLGRKVDQLTDNISSVLIQTNTRIDNLKVHVVAKEVETTNKNSIKASSLGTIK